MNHVQSLIAFESALTKAHGAKTKDQALAIIEQWARAELRDRRISVTDAQISHIREMAEEGESVAVIADKLDVSNATVRRVLRGQARYGRKGGA